MSDETLVSLLSERVHRAPDTEAVVVIAEDGSRQTLTAGRLLHEAHDRARGLNALGLVPGDVVFLVIRHGTELLASVLGALCAGSVVAILAPPGRRGDDASFAARMGALVECSKARAVICAPDLREVLAAALADVPCRVLDDDALTKSAGDGRLPAAPLPDQLALLQHTSGSTGLQKVVAHTHRAMVAFLRTKAEKLDFTSADVTVSWLPLYHDMGLVSGFLLPLLWGARCVLMSAFHWTRDPALLLRAVHEYRGTFSWMPNAGLNHCARAIRETELEGLDLSSWRVLASGGEPVRLSSIQAFLTRFRRCGLRDSTMQAAYGMAEAVEGITSTVGGAHHSVPVDWVRVRPLQAERRAVPASPDDPGVVALVSCGSPYRGVEVRIVDDEGRTLPERLVGEVTARSSHTLTGGYYLRPDMTAAALRDGWLRTGDLGYMADGQLYVCGRQKDLIIVGGRNVHPEDIETIANAADGVTPGRAVAFGVEDAHAGTDRTVLVCELGVAADARAVERELRRRVAQELDVNLGQVAVVPRGWILKTSSGKLARAANREKYLAVPRSP